MKTSRAAKASLCAAMWLITAALTQVTCSATLDWDQDGLACDDAVVDGRTDFCLQGFTCLTSSDVNARGRCVRNNSLKVGSACSSSAQCVAGYVCPIDLLGGGGVAGNDGVKQCAKSCNSAASDPYYTSAACPSGTVCMPFLNARAIDPQKALEGACLPSTPCSAGGACTTPSVSAGTCIDLGGEQKACITGCEITWSAALSYSDNCDSLHSCQPVGAVNAQQFACTYNGQNSASNPLGGIGGQTIAATGAPCSTLKMPCNKGDVCAPTGICANYCLITANQTFPCPTGQSCCPLTSFATSVATGYCSAVCK